MRGFASSSTFLFIWIAFLALMIVGLSLILLWAVRARQFSNQDRARYLPLRSGIPKASRNDREECEHHEEKRGRGRK